MVSEDDKLLFTKFLVAEAKHFHLADTNNIVFSDFVDSERLYAPCEMHNLISKLESI